MDGRDFFAISLYAEPGFRSPLLGDPRYDALVRRIGLEPDGP